jgi:hypothetical protein
VTGDDDRPEDGGDDDRPDDDEWADEWLRPDELEDLDEQALEAARRQLAHGLFGPSRWFPRVGPGQFDNQLPDDGRRLVGRMASELRDLLLTEDDSLRRLYPTAYPDDPARDAEFATFAHDQMLMARLEALDVVERTLEADELTADDLQAWMQVINQARLVLGTRLDVSEDDPRDGDPSHPDAAGFELYHLLGRLVGDLVDALHADL